MVFLTLSVALRPGFPELFDDSANKLRDSEQYEGNNQRCAEFEQKLLHGSILVAWGKCFWLFSGLTVDVYSPRAGGPR